MQKYLSIPYVYNGRSFDGADCYGLVMLFYMQEFGIELADYETGTNSSDEIRGTDWFIGNACNEFDAVDEKQAEKGDVVLFSLRSDTPTHIGILLGGGRFIHLNAQGCSIQRLSRWQRAVTGFYRYRGKLCR